MDIYQQQDYKIKTDVSPETERARLKMIQKVQQQLLSQSPNNTTDAVNLSSEQINKTKWNKFFVQKSQKIHNNSEQWSNKILFVSRELIFDWNVTKKRVFY